VKSGATGSPSIFRQSSLFRSAIRDYFAPLQKWLDEQNQGKPIGWSMKGGGFEFYLGAKTPRDNTGLYAQLGWQRLCFRFESWVA